MVALARPSAGAGSVELQATGETSLGVSDNITAAPDVPLPGGAKKTVGAFLVLRPGVTLGSLSSRVVQRLSYTFDEDVFFAQRTSSSTGNRLEYQGFFDVAPRVSALLGAAASESDTYAALVVAPPASGLLPLLPAGTTRMVELGAEEALTFQLSTGWRSTEGVGFTLGAPLFGGDAPKTLAPTARLGAEYSFTGDALGVEARAAYAAVWHAIRADGTRVRRDSLLTVGGVGTYRHDLGRFFTTALDAGALRVVDPQGGDGRWYPTGGARLGYTNIVGDAELAYTHSLTTSVLLGQTQLADEIRLRAGLPLDSRGIFSVAASAGYQRARLLDEGGHLATRLSILLADVTFGWQLEPWLLLGVRGQHIDQRSDTHVNGLPVSFVQNNVMLGAVLRFPPNREMSARYRAPLRVDRSDEVRGTAQPAADNVAAPTGRAR
jgi:hypothetical protein